MFLKLKTEDGDNILISVSQISTVTASDKGTYFEMKNGDAHRVKDGFQAVGNRLAEVGATVA